METAVQQLLQDGINIVLLFLTFGVGALNRALCLILTGQKGLSQKSVQLFQSLCYYRGYFSL